MVRLSCGAAVLIRRGTHGRVGSAWIVGSSGTRRMASSSAAASARTKVTQGNVTEEFASFPNTYATPKQDSRKPPQKKDSRREQRNTTNIANDPTRRQQVDSQVKEEDFDGSSNANWEDSNPRGLSSVSQMNRRLHENLLADKAALKEESKKPGNKKFRSSSRVRDPEPFETFLQKEGLTYQDLDLVCIATGIERQGTLGFDNESLWNELSDRMKRQRLLDSMAASSRDAGRDIIQLIWSAARLGRKQEATAIVLDAIPELIRSTKNFDRQGTLSTAESASTSSSGNGTDNWKCKPDTTMSSCSSSSDNIAGMSRNSTCSSSTRPASDQIGDIFGSFTESFSSSPRSSSFSGLDARKSEFKSRSSCKLTPQDLSVLTWSLSKLECYEDPSILKIYDDICDLLLREHPFRIKDFSLPGIAQLFHGLQSARKLHPDVFRLLIQDLTKHRHFNTKAAPRALSNILRMSSLFFAEATNAGAPGILPRNGSSTAGAPSEGISAHNQTTCRELMDIFLKKRGQELQELKYTPQGVAYVVKGVSIVSDYNIFCGQLAAYANTLDWTRDPDARIGLVMGFANLAKSLEVIPSECYHFMGRMAEEIIVSNRETDSSTILWAFATMGLGNRRLLETLSVLPDTFSSRDMTQTLYACAVYRYNKIPSKALLWDTFSLNPEAQFPTRSQERSRNFAVTIWALCVLECYQLANEFAAAYFERLTKLEGQMGVEVFLDQHLKVSERQMIHFAHLCLQQRARKSNSNRVSSGIAIMEQDREEDASSLQAPSSRVTDKVHVEKKLFNSWEGRIPALAVAQSVRPSKVQGSVTQILTTSKLVAHCENEYVLPGSNNLLIADILAFLPNSKPPSASDNPSSRTIAIEIDGPAHYVSWLDSDGVKTLKGSSAFKHRLMRELGYKVLSINVTEFDNLLSLAEKQQYLTKLIRDLE